MAEWVACKALNPVSCAGCDAIHMPGVMSLHAGKYCQR
ncbi:hypothetical protein BN133_2027 [Cronobacter dublinensis 582]|nr:hypothetical protein BN133_2027 [Cronobacter dublinensis 582]